MNNKKVNLFSLMYYFGLLNIGGGIVFLMPLLSLLFYPNELKTAIPFIISAIGLLVLGGLLKHYNIGEEERKLDIKEGYILIVVFWLWVTVIGSIPFKSQGIPFIDALFESMSGFSTTGLTVLNVEQLPKILLLWRSTTQFVGGIGFVVLVFSAEVTPVDYLLYKTSGRTSVIQSDVTATMRWILKIYVIYFLGGILLFWAAGMELFDAINHAMTGISTGGFSTKASSIGYWDSLYIEGISILLVLIGTINFVVHYNLFQRKIKALIKHVEVRFTVVVIILASIFLLKTTSSSVRDSIFQAVTALSTAGFSTDYLTEWSEIGKFTLTILMIIGGGYGATAGGLKQVRVITSLKTLVWGLKQRITQDDQNHEIKININGDVKTLSQAYIKKEFSVIIIYFLVYLLGVFIFLLNGYGLTDSLFEVASTVSTIGLSVGITGPDTSLSIKITQIIGMWLGRLEFFTIIAGLVATLKLLLKK